MKGKVLQMLRTCGGATLTAYLQVPEGSCSGSISLTRNNAIVASPYLSHLLAVTKDLSEIRERCVCIIGYAALEMVEDSLNLHITKRCSRNKFRLPARKPR